MPDFRSTDGAADNADDAFGRAGDAVEAVKSASPSAAVRTRCASAAQSSPAAGLTDPNGQSKPPESRCHARRFAGSGASEGDAGQSSHRAGLLRPGVELPTNSMLAPL